MSHWSIVLKRYGACEEAVTWAATQPSRKVAWKSCERPDWMFFILGKLETDRKTLVLAACACARLALKYVMAGEDRPRICIETAEAWVRGEATIGQVRAARHAAAYAAAYAAYAAYAAAYAAAAAADAADAAYAAAAAAYAADAAAHAAAAAAYAADAAAHAAAAAYREQMRIDCCHEIRRMVPVFNLPLRRRSQETAE